MKKEKKMAFYNYKTIFFAFFSSFMNLVFSIYNGIIGIIYSSVWNLSISGFYFLLFLIKQFLIINEFRTKRKKLKNKRHGFIIASFVLLFVMTLIMIGPSAILIMDERVVNMGLIPAIASSAYTFYSLISSLINLNKSFKSNNPVVKQFKLINFISTLMSLLVLQNTLIVVKGGYDESLFILSICSTTIIFILIFFLIVFSFIKYLISYKKSNEVVEQ